MSIVIGVPPQVQELVQKGLLQRAFHDSLYPNLAFRAEAMAEEWPANSGEEIVMTRAGLLKPVTTPLPVGTDPTPNTVPYEQWTMVLNQWGDALDTHMPSSTTANANILIRNIKQLGLQAGQSINRIARNALHKPYLSGQTVLNAVTAAADTSIRVAALNGFTDVVIPGVNARPQIVSSQYPLPITIGTGASKVSASVIGFQPDLGSDPFGPGVLFLAAQVGAIFPNRSVVKSAFAPRIIRSNAAESIDGINAADTLVLQQAINACALLRRANVPPHDDGFYHAHISPLTNAQLFADPVFQRLNQSLPHGDIYHEGFIGTMSGVMFFMNNESPELSNVGTTTATSASALYAQEMGAEVVNASGVQIGRTILTGKGCLYERYLNEDQYVTEAGLTGKTGEFQVVNNGYQILTERIRFIIRSPLDRLQQIVSSAWSISTGFAAPSDITAPSGPERYKRAIVLEHALSL